MEAIKVYIDTNVLKLSATKLSRMVPRQQTIIWGDITQEVTVHDLVEINPNDLIGNPELKEEAGLLPVLAEHGKQGRVKYLIQIETLFESWGIPNMDSSSGQFYGAPIDKADEPILYGRVMVGAGVNAKEGQFDFLSHLDHPRFKELQKMVGAYQGPGKRNRNQLLDAFHVWCAEHNQCDYMLTLDFKLIRVIENNRKNKPLVKVVRPSELLEKFEGRT